MCTEEIQKLSVWDAEGLHAGSKGKLDTFADLTE